MESEVAGNTPITHLASISEALSQGLQNLCRIDEDRRGEVEQRAASSLDSEVWCNLPEHLVDTVLAWLPPASLFRLRTVCKRWNSVVSSRAFLDTCSKIKSRLPYFLMFADHFHRRVAAVYDVSVSSWHLLPFSSFMHCRFPESFLVLAAAGGLLCLEGTGSQSGTMFVSNPITRVYKKLPRMIAMKSPYVVGMVVDDEMKSYKILVAQDGETLASQVYDSSTNRWSLTGVYHRRTAILAGATFYNGLLFCLTFSPNGLLAFDLERGQWLEVKLALPPSLSCPNLMTHQDRLLLIGGIEELGSLQSVHVWQLHPTKPEWMDVERVPDELFKRLFTSSSGHFICVGQGDFICLHEYYSPEILMYDIVRSSWQWLPGCSLNDNIEARSVLGFAFQPRIEAVP
ncbi:hypothetical protein SELMODRAFT_78419 [Selaginella moellendorffii]|uniref:F-box domain-containing protein n=2 Tax=Selaginella moellendorffii TaxID=88036 RepID=D8QVC6_SELML|nr:hypothetical protein SELMODRAFT_78419 [Selaginella moellendorffii]